MELFGASERLSAAVLDWENTQLETSRFGVQKLSFGRQVFAHLHGSNMLDVLLPKPIRVELVLAGDAEPHPVLPTSGWITIYLQDAADEERALKILRRAYDILRERRPTRPCHVTIEPECNSLS